MVTISRYPYSSDPPSPVYQHRVVCNIDSSGDLAVESVTEPESNDAPHPDDLGPQNQLGLLENAGWNAPLLASSRAGSVAREGGEY